MEKRKKRETGKKIKKFDKHGNLTTDSKRNSKFLGVDNCITIYISPETQRIIGCQIGEDITAERPWIDVKKYKIEDNIYLHENSSEFLSIKKIIEDYPEDDIFMGSYRTNQEKPEEFMICASVEAKKKIMAILLKEREALLERVRQLVYCQPNPWTSLGSEREVKSMQNINLRPLLKVIVESKTPILVGIHRIKLKYRFASNNFEFRTYDEILPDHRSRRKFAFKVRYDRASQITSERINTRCQTTLPYPTNKYTQTNEKFYVLQLTEHEDVKLNEGLKRIIEIMEDTLEVNFNINLYNNDYDFVGSYKQSYARDSREIMNFHDVIICKDLYYGSLSWNALISGLIAVSYVERPMKLIVNQNNVEIKKRPHRSFSDKIILLWCYTDNLAAKLFMHANFEITSISFCPHDETILVGGGCGGQIVIWDLKNKLKQVEAKEYLSITELNHRNIVRNYTSWVKWPPGVRHVFPTVISEMSSSHKSPVISIQWLPSYHRMTKLGQVERFQPEGDLSQCYLKPLKSYQFLTCSTEDSCVLAWEINQTGQFLKPDHSVKKKTRRLSHLPKSLNEGISPLKKFNKRFQPFFKLKLELTGNRDHRIFATDLFLNNPKAEYELLNPQSLAILKDRTYLREKVPAEPPPHSQTFAVSSTSGYMVKCDWDGNNFDQGQMINEQTCICTDFLVVHDGPIVCCKSYLHYPECILTVGGSVFGIWVTSALKRPIFWRKGGCRYISGLWSSAYPLLCLLLREDNYLEYWDLTDSLTTPIRLTKLKGSKIMDIISDSTRSHARKGTYIFTDLKGVIKVQEQPIYNTIKMSKEEREGTSASVIEQMLKRKKHLKSLNERLKGKYNLSKIDVMEPTTNTIDKRPTVYIKTDVTESRNQDKQRPSRATKWQKKEEIRMYETLVQQKRIDVAELKQNTVPLMKILNKRLEQQKKIDELLMRKEEIFDGQKQSVLQSLRNIQSKKFTVSFPREMEGVIKAKYFADYKLIESQALQQMRLCPHRFALTWDTILGNRMSDFQNATTRQNILDKERFSSIGRNQNDTLTKRKSSFNSDK